MKKRLLIVGAATVVLAGCGNARLAASSKDISYEPFVPPSSVTALAKRREATADRSAAALFKRVPRPPGAVRARAPSGTDQLAISGLGVSTVDMTAARYSVWRVPGTGPAVIAYEKRHLFPHLRTEGLGSTPEGWTGYEVFGSMVNGRPPWAVSVAVEPDGGQTLVRFDAGVAWIYPRSPREVVPAGVTGIDIRGGGVDRRVTDATQVRQLVRWFDALNVSQPGPAVSCGVAIESTVTFGFRSANRAPLATAFVPSAGPTSNCDSIRFSIDGKRQRPLIDNLDELGHSFVDRVQRLLGFRFSEPRR
jgi:hypothetical protein